jgi:hypothetical protein
VDVRPAESIQDLPGIADDGQVAVILDEQSHQAVLRCAEILKFIDQNMAIDLLIEAERSGSLPEQAQRLGEHGRVIHSSTPGEELLVCGHQGF